MLPRDPLEVSQETPQIFLFRPGHWRPQEARDDDDVGGGDDDDGPGGGAIAVTMPALLPGKCPGSSGALWRPPSAPKRPKEASEGRRMRQEEGREDILIQALLYACMYACMYVRM